jgi:hypothetical protein
MSAIALIALLAVSQVETDAANPQSEKEKQSASAQLVLELAQKYSFFSDDERKTKLDFQARPLLTYSNPIRGDVYGDVFVWTLHGRPQVVAAIFDYRTNGWMDSEMHTLASAETVGVRDDVAFWQPGKPGIELRAVPSAPAPADTAAKRLSQMRMLARQFSVERNHPEQKKDSLRMLSQPIYRYESKQAQVLDGAMFVFVEGTDPEAFLLLEAGGGDKPAWQFAFSRMNIVEFTGLHTGEQVWHVGPVDWDTMFDKQEPYAIVRENPRRGLTRSR